MPNEKYLETIKEFRLIDDTFFSTCLDNNEEDVEYILRIILDKPNLKVLKYGTHIIYVNGSYKDDSDSALGNLIHDFFCFNPA